MFVVIFLLNSLIELNDYNILVSVLPPTISQIPTNHLHVMTGYLLSDGFIRYPNSK